MQLELKDVLAVLGSKTLEVEILQGQNQQLQQQVQALTDELKIYQETGPEPPPEV